MTERPNVEAGAPRLSAVQLAWLQEIGVDKRLLARYVSQVVEAPAMETGKPQPTDLPVAPARQTSAQAASPVAAPPLPSTKHGPEKSAPPVQQAAASPGAIPHELEALQAYVSECQACPLHGGRGQTVFGAGAHNEVEWLVIGEAPGERDDRLGLPFQGKAGDLLRNMMSSLLAPDGSGPGVYYTNVIKCRPRGNRKPKAEEIAACMPLLHRQISLMRPRRLLLLGHLAAQAVLATDQAFEQLRGSVQIYKTEQGVAIPTVVTYHPASLLARPQDKARAWVDLILARHAAQAA